MKKIYHAASLVFMIILVCISAVQAQFPQQTLNQYVADLQKNPNDYALREKIIRHAQTMKPAPAVPEDAKRYLSRGIAAMKEAKSKDEFSDAVNEFEKAALSAPWFANAYYNLGVAQDKAGAYANAIRSLRLYLLASPDARDAEAVNGLIYEIEYRQEKATRESSPQAIAAKKQEEYANWLKKIDGRKYRDTRGGVPAVLEVRGNTLVTVGPGSDGRMAVLAGPWEIKGRSASTPRVLQREPFLPVQTTFIISENGDRIIEHRDFSDGDMREYVWVWQR